jgi:hypothetical protein
MHVDLLFLLLIYAFSTISLGVSVYALWTLEEIRQQYKKKNNVKTPNAYDQYKNKPPVKPTRGKGHWD